MVQTDCPDRWFQGELAPTVFPPDGPCWVVEAGTVYRIAGVLVCYGVWAEIEALDGRRGRVYAAQLHDTEASARADAAEWLRRQQEKTPTVGAVEAD